MTRTRAHILVLAAAAAAAVTIAVAAPAQAAPPSTVDVTVTTAGFTAPASAAPGAVTLNVSTSDPEGAWIGLVRLRSGVTLGEYLDDLTIAFAGGPGSGEASREVERDVTAYGGVAVLNGQTASTSQYLAPGTYHLIDYKEVGRPGLASTVRELRVSGRWSTAMPSARSHVVMYPTAEGTGFLAPERIAAGAPLRVTNVSTQLNEAILMPLRDGLDGADVAAWFADMSRPYPFTGGPSGMVVLSPGLTQVVDLDLAPGRYALVSWAHDHETGEYHTAQGMHAVVELT
ncbi:hypothetical protein [Phytomonospora endophytica]|uniref:Uncharacterized protein n=1 Tax=Phytomonospora endophytica TaxID=714109 RepID=A0A841FCS5_9ACTN|nr:hypothetical protein [Phytomonospora endophytica]MBB6035091.1 hypothetical protein [Phytomonospora endophytica]GIG64160.1 hypothetical protein Pen01_04550 [Phytomonospora endophytica]